MSPFLILCIIGAACVLAYLIIPKQPKRKRATVSPRWLDSMLWRKS